MDYYDYNCLRSTKVGFGWLDITDNIKDSMMLALTKNITEYWVQELSWYQVEIKFKKSVDELLHWAAEQDLNYLVINTTGSSLSSDSGMPFIQMVSKYIMENPNLSIVGHLLDKKDMYYEIHHQTMLININWWKSARKPNFGKESNESITVTLPLRSNENHHDDYTPLWISEGTELKTFSRTRQGWNLIKTALETSDKVNSWPEYIRSSKCYLYPEVEYGAASKLSGIINKLQTCAHFVANTESVPGVNLDECGGKFDVVISPASGITPVLTAWKCGLKEGDYVKIYDISPIALEMQKAMKQQLVDYKDFKSSFYNIFNKKLEYFGHEMLYAIENINRMQEIINKLLPEGLEDFINNVWPKIKVSYTKIDLFEEKAAEKLLHNINKTDRTYLHLTNIFHYQNTAWIYDTKKRYSAEKRLISNIAIHNMDAIYVRSLNGGNKKIDTNNLPSTVKENPMLKEIPWYQSN
jgi:hypothetical protein